MDVTCESRQNQTRPAGRFRKELFFKQPGTHPGRRIVLSEHGDARLGTYLMTHKLGHFRGHIGSIPRKKPDEN